MSYCMKNIPGTYGICVLQSGHIGPCSTAERKRGRVRDPIPENEMYPLPRTEEEALGKIELFSEDRLITSPAVENFHTRRAMGESIESAYRGAFEFMIRRAG